MIEITDADLLFRLTNYEDHFVERKSSGDSKDWLKTVVGFANSAPIDYPAVLYIGVRDGGEIEENGNLDSLQKNFAKRLDDAYPPRLLHDQGAGERRQTIPCRHRARKRTPAHILQGAHTSESAPSQSGI
jgi:hypothetical protein